MIIERASAATTNFRLFFVAGPPTESAISPPARFSQGTTRGGVARGATGATAQWAGRWPRAGGAIFSQGTPRPCGRHGIRQPGHRRQWCCRRCAAVQAGGGGGMYGNGGDGSAMTAGGGGGTKDNGQNRHGRRQWRWRPGGVGRWRRWPGRWHGGRWWARRAPVLSDCGISRRGWRRWRPELARWHGRRRHQAWRGGDGGGGGDLSAKLGGGGGGGFGGLE